MVEYTKKYLIKFVEKFEFIYKDMSIEDQELGRTFAFLLEPPLQVGQSQDRRLDVVLFLHGTGNDSIFPHLGLFHTLLSNNFAVMSFDLPGHGASSTTKILRHGCFNLVKRIVESLMAARTSSVGHSNFFGFGYSLGGAYLARLAAEGFKFDGVFLTATPIYLELKTKDLLFEILSLGVADIYQNRCYYGLGGLFPAVGSYRRASFPIRLGERGPYWNVVKEVIASCEVEKSLGLVSCRTQLIYAQWDHIAPISHGHRLSHIGQKQHQMMVIPKQTHYSVLFCRHLQQSLLHFVNGCFDDP